MWIHSTKWTKWRTMNVMWCQFWRWRCRAWRKIWWVRKAAWSRSMSNPGKGERSTDGRSPVNGILLIPIPAAQRRTSMWSGAQSESLAVLGRDPNALTRLIYQIDTWATFSGGFLLNKICFTKQDPGPRSYPRVSSLSEPKSSTDMVFSPLPYYRHLFVV